MLWTFGPDAVKVLRRGGRCSAIAHAHSFGLSMLLYRREALAVLTAGLPQLLKLLEHIC